MNVDFLLTEQGDIVLELSKKYRGPKLSFRKGKKQSLSISFHVEEETLKKTKSFVTSFLVSRSDSERAKAQLTNKDAQEKQSLRLAVKTERGDIYSKPEFGSDMFKLEHRDLHDTQTLQAFEDEAKIAAKKADIFAKKEKDTTALYGAKLTLGQGKRKGEGV